MHADSGAAQQAAPTFNAGNAAYRAGHWQDALGHYEAALALHPGMAAAALQRARCLVQLQQWLPAREAFAVTLRMGPVPNDLGQQAIHYSAWLEAGHLCRQTGQEQQALQAYQRALQLAPQRHEAPLALARVLEAGGQWDAAARAYQEALQCAATQGTGRVREVHLHMARYRLERGDAERAQLSLQAALTQADALADSPDDAAEIRIDIGECLLRLGRREEALATWTLASQATREPTLARLAALSYHFNLWQDAIDVSRRNVALHPASAWAHWNLAYVLNQCWHMDEAQTVLLQAEALAPLPGAAELRASMAARRGDADAALLQYLALAEAPDATVVHKASTAMCALYSDRLSAEAVADLHRRLFAPLGVGARSPQGFQRAPLQGRRIRLGLVSQDFHHHHPVNLFMQPVLREFDRSRFEVFVYCTGTTYDAQTERARQRCDHWLQVSHLSNAQLARQIDSDGIDVLLDQAGPTDPQRLGLYAQRAAPVQASYLGYPSSSGLPQMDWIIGDAVVTPVGHEAQYSERIARLPGTVFCYAPEADYPYPAYPAAHARRPLTFGSFNNLPKLTPHTLLLWAQVLAAVPGSRLLLKAPSLGDATAVCLLGERLQALGVDLARVEFRGPVLLSEMMAEYADVDIALDPVPYNGGTTTLQALWMGVPVICKRGSSFVSRMGASFMAAAGLPEWVAEDDAGYVRIAVKQARNRQALLALKQGLRARLQSLPAWDVVQHTRNLEAALEAMCMEAFAGQAQSSSPAAISGNNTSV